MRRVESAFADYLESEGSVDLLWSDKVGYVFLTINEKTHESESCDDLHTASQLCHRLLDDMAITVLLQTKRNHNFTNMDKDEAVRVRAFWKPVIEKLPDYAYAECRENQGISHRTQLPHPQGKRNSLFAERNTRRLQHCQCDNRQRGVKSAYPLSYRCHHYRQIVGKEQRNENESYRLSYAKTRILLCGSESAHG